MISLLVLRVFLGWHLLAGFSANRTAAPPLSERDGYEQGVRLRADGKWEEALKKWNAVYDSVSALGQVDPRLGIAFIELATVSEAEAYYEKASEIYMWGFTGSAPSEYGSAVIEEAMRVVPLLDVEVAKKWPRKSKEKYRPEHSHEIRLFWLQRDPLPSTALNERLIEHWQRIACARKKYRKNSNGIYDCDDRGTIYVKYGEPLHTRSGSFGYSEDSKAVLMQWIRDPTLRSLIEREDPHPAYDVWLYGELGNVAPVVFLFSHRSGRGAYGLMNGVEDVVPRDMERALGFGREGRYVYQLLYYAELMNFADQYRERFRELWGMWLTSGGSGAYRLQGQFFSNGQVDREMRESIEPEKSVYEEYYAPMDIGARNIRFLNDSNEPELAIVVISALGYRESWQPTIAPNRVEHTLLIRDAQLTEIDRLTRSGSGELDNGFVFQLPHAPNQSHFSFTVQAHGNPSDTLLAMGRFFSKPARPLNTSFDSLEVSDLVIGMEFFSEEEKQSHRPLPLLPTHGFTQKDAMQIYLEVYHVKPLEDGSGHIKIALTANRLDDKGKKVKKRGEVSLSFSATSVNRTVKENYGIDLSKVKPGTYELNASVRDEATSQQIVRRVKFRVVE